MKQQTFKMDFPVEVHGQTYKELTLRSIKAKDLRITCEGNNLADSEISLIAALANVSPTVIDELELVDYNKVAAFVREQLTPKKPLT